MSAPTETHSVRPVSLSLAFAPVHKSAMGVAVGIVAGLVLFAVTAFHIAAGAASGPNLMLLSQYFYGYEISWRGAFIALFWGFTTGFVIGWFTAFVRNFVVTLTVFTLRTKAELAQTQDFLDHI